MSQECDSIENFNILIEEDLDIAVDQKSISKWKKMQNGFVKCRRESVTTVLIIFVIAMLAIGKALPGNILE